LFSLDGKVDPLFLRIASVFAIFVTWASIALSTSERAASSAAVILWPFSISVACCSMARLWVGSAVGGEGFEVDGRAREVPESPC